MKATCSGSNKKAVSWSLLGCFALLILRLMFVAIAPDSVLCTLKDRYELCPPPRRTSTLLEADVAVSLGIDPFADGVASAPPSPVLLSFIRLANAHSERRLALLGVLFDMLSALMNNSLTSREDAVPALLLLAHPAALLASLAGALTSVESFFVLCSARFAVGAFPVLAGSSLAVAVSLFPHLVALAPCMLLLLLSSSGFIERPVVMPVAAGTSAHKHSRLKQQADTSQDVRNSSTCIPGSRTFWWRLFRCTGLFIASCTLTLPLLYLFCTFAFGSAGTAMSGIRAFAYENVFVDDHTPDMGLHWYLGAETFSRFRAVLHAAVHFVSLLLLPSFVVRTRAYEPLAALVFALGCAVLVRPHASAADTALWLSLLTHLPHITDKLNAPFVECTLYFLSLSFAVGSWEMWVENKTGNANHFFGASLAHVAFQCVVLNDFVHATLTQCDAHHKQLVHSNTAHRDE